MLRAVWFAALATGPLTAIAADSTKARASTGSSPSAMATSRASAWIRSDGSPSGICCAPPGSVPRARTRGCWKRTSNGVMRPSRPARGRKANSTSKSMNWPASMRSCSAPTAESPPPRLPATLVFDQHARPAQERRVPRVPRTHETPREPESDQNCNGIAATAGPGPALSPSSNRRQEPDSSSPRSSAGTGRIPLWTAVTRAVISPTVVTHASGSRRLKLTSIPNDVCNAKPRQRPIHLRS